MLTGGCKSVEMPPTKLVDGSDPLYKSQTPRLFANATNEVGGSFRSFLIVLSCKFELLLGAAEENLPRVAWFGQRTKKDPFLQHCDLGRFSSAARDLAQQNHYLGRVQSA